MILTIITWHFGWQPSPEAVAEGGGHPPGLGSQHALPIWRTVPRASAERIFLFTVSAEQIPQEASMWRQADLIMAGHHLAHPVLVYRVRIFEVHIITIWFDTLWASVITRSSTARSRGYVITETVWECLDLWLAVSQSPFLHTCCHEGGGEGWAEEGRRGALRQENLCLLFDQLLLSPHQNSFRTAVGRSVIPICKRE